MVELKDYTKQSIVNAVQFKKVKNAMDNANMKMTKGDLVRTWKNKLSEGDLKAINPSKLGRAGRPPNPKPKPKATSSSGTQTTDVPKRQARKRKSTKNQNPTKSTTKQTNITKFLK
jgi:hypothetical protein